MEKMDGNGVSGLDAKEDLSNFSRVYCAENDDTKALDESLMPTEEEIERAMANFFPFISPPEIFPATDRESVELMVSQLGGHGTALERIRRMEERLAEASQGVQKASKLMEPMLDEVERSLKLYNNGCRATSFQTVVLKTVEIDADGICRTVNNNGPKDNEDGFKSRPKDESPEPAEPPSPPSKPLDHTDEQFMDTDKDTVTPADDDEEVSAIGEVKPGQTLFGENAKFTVAPTPRILPRMIPAVNKKVYAMRGSALNSWALGTVLKVDRNEFHVQLESSGRGKSAKEVRVFDAKHLAFSLKTPFLLPVGARIIARFNDELKENKAGGSEFYAGIVAERPIPHNQNRYLIFFDDGYAQYVAIENVLWVCESSKDVWNDVHPSSQAFIKEYLKIYPERPMVRLSKGTIVSTEWNGNWWIGRVVDVDCSLVKIFFEADNRYEWIYRGSQRLAPLFNKQKRAEARLGVGPDNKVLSKPSRAPRRHDVHAASHSNEAKIEYVNYGSSSTAPPAPADKIVQTARKSTTLPPGGVQQWKPSTTNPLSNVAKKPPGVTTSTGLLEYEGRMTRINIPKSVEEPIPLVPHSCKPSCVRPYKENDKDVKMINPLTLPMFYGFNREVAKNPRRSIYYRAPCGRRLRDLEEMHDFLNLTKYNMGIDHFCFDYAVDCFNEFVPSSNHFIISDITYGKENVPVQCCNSVDHEYPEYVEYSKDRQPAADVYMNLDADFLSCCECTDDCSDKEKCACWQMTMEGVKTRNDEFNFDVGYQYRRLTDHLVTGIYECNKRCPCKKTCLNRVVQFDMKWQLQIFKTSNKGWAIRPIHDIPQGAFICVYAGQLLTEQGANEDGKAFGDEYLAELDYIEVCESYKEGFESDVVDPELGVRQRRRSGQDVITDKENRGKKKSVREMFGADEYCYIMDAKSSGNIGRYLNHSCQPNVFVQNVFVDTHDLRFPWVAFFAFKHIRAGAELTWDYNYDIGSVPGKTMYCYCGTPECRGRLL